MSKLLMLKGLPASGKSTYAKELVSQGWKRVNKDDLRAMIDNNKWSRDNETVILDTETSIAINYLAEGHNVVVDDTNFAHEQTWKKVSELTNSEFEVKFFDTPYHECIDRDLKRGDKSVGSKVISDMYHKHVKPELVEYKPELVNAYIFDIDGTLAKMDGRGAYDYTKVNTDKPNRDVVNLCRILFRVAPIIVVSGRKDECAYETHKWLYDNEIPYNVLYMRKSDDDRNDAIVKKEIYEQHIKDKYNVLGVFDDRNRVVDMWRSLGLTCFQVDWDDF